MISKLFEKILLLEKKDHLIKKLNLTDGQKQQLVDHFNKFPHLESKIDWNRKDLSWEEFEPLLTQISKSQFKKNMSRKEMGGLKEGEDYVTLYDQEDVFLAQVLNYRQAVYFGSKNFMGHEGKWCISSNDKKYWKQYTENGSRFIIQQYNNQSKFMIENKIRPKTRNYYNEKDVVYDSKQDQNLNFIRKIEPILNNIDIDQYDSLINYNFLKPKGFCIIGKDISVKDIARTSFDDVTELTFQSNIKNIKKYLSIIFRSDSLLDATFIYPKHIKGFSTINFEDCCIKKIDFSQSNITEIDLLDLEQTSQDRLTEIVFPQKPFYLTGKPLTSWHPSTVKLTNQKYQIAQNPEVFHNYGINLRSFDDIKVPDIVYTDQIPVAVAATKLNVKQILDRGKQLPIGFSNVSFREQKSLEKLVLGPIRQIDDDNNDLFFQKRAFQGLENIKEIDLTRSSMTYLSSSCFFKCINLKKVILPPELIDLPLDCFRGCKNMTELTGFENTLVRKVGAGVFTEVGLKRINFPKTVDNIYNYFASRSQIEVLDFSRADGSSLYISDEFQFNMDQLKTVILPEGANPRMVKRLKSYYPKVRFIFSQISESTLFENIIRGC